MASPLKAAPGPRLRTLAARGIPVAAGIMLVAGITACSSTKPEAAASPGTTTSAGSDPSPVTAASGPAATGSGNPTVAATIHAKGPKKDIINGLLIFEGQLRLSGASHRHTAFHAFPGVKSPGSSCAHIAAIGTPASKGQGPLFVIPAPPLGGTVSLAAEVEPYRGPGTYGKSSLEAVSATVTVGNTSYNLLAPGSSVTVKFAANGSGEFKFRHAVAAGTGKPSLSGTIQWSCSVQV